MNPYKQAFEISGQVREAPSSDTYSVNEVMIINASKCANKEFDKQVQKEG